KRSSASCRRGNPNRGSEQERSMASTRVPRLPVTPASNTILLDDHRFHDLLPDEDWGRLPLAIWRRFSKRFADGETVVYVGEVDGCLLQPGRLVAGAA